MGAALTTAGGATVSGRSDRAARGRPGARRASPIRNAYLRSLARSRLLSPVRRGRRLVKRELRRDRRDNEHVRLLLALALPADANCIDVGGHEGRVLEEILRVAPSGRHIAYEPVPESHAALARRFPSVDVRRAALWNRVGELPFAHVTSRPGYSGLRATVSPARETIETIVVRAETLDGSLPPDYAPTFVKIDVEGAEAEVIEGAIETLATYKPIVVFEHGAAARSYGSGPERVFELLCDGATLRIFDLDGNGPYSRAGFVDVVARGRYWNFVAHR